MAAAASSPAKQPERTLTVLYASQTGTAQDVAERIGRMARKRAFNVTLSSMDAFPLVALPSSRTVVLVAATTGDGDPPDNMKAVEFSVFGLGDSAYAAFNAVARKLHRRFLQLGATEFCPRGLGDDQSEPLGMDGDLESWLEVMWGALLQKYPLPAGWIVDDAPEQFASRYSLRLAPVSAAQHEAATPGGASRSLPPDPPSNALGERSKAIFKANMLVNTRLTQPGWSQDVRHLEFELPSDAPRYSAGDIACIWPENPQTLVARLCDALSIPLETRLCISLRGQEQESASVSGTSAVQAALQLSRDGTAQPTGPLHKLPPQATVQELLTHYVDITGTPKRSVFEQLSFFASDPEQAEKLVEISAPGGADLYASYIKRERRNIVEVLEDFTSLKPPLEALLELLPPLQPRKFSIASAPSDAPKLHLCVAVVNFTTPHKRSISGLCSSFLAGLPASPQGAAPRATSVLMCLEPGTLRLPRPYTDLGLPSTGTSAERRGPVLLIGPGTGVAPMRSLIRQAANVLKGAPGAPEDWDIRLYFGCRKESQDYLYASEWADHVAQGELSAISTAFSRDGPSKVYVQTKLWEQRDSVSTALQHPCSCVYIAGSAKRMPADVLDILQTILAHSCGGQGAAKALLSTMRRQGRLVVEAWS